MSDSINILETTLRDGSYACNFNFSVDETRLICEGLEHAGIGYIEIGHGVGLGASGERYGFAREPDEMYLKAAASSIVRAKYGVFCIPGIASLEDIDKAADGGCSFIRIGTNATEVGKSESYIARAKSRGLEVMTNYMKSYLLSPKEFAENVLRSESFGADIVYVVDSAGGMFEDDVRSYINAIRRVSEITIGFHGHNNLGMAVANNLVAIDAGATFVDMSLQGLGRSSGNAPTECCVAALQKKGLCNNIDLISLLDMGKEWIEPLIQKKGLDTLGVIAGLADFHSSYMPKIQRCCTRFNVRPEPLIIEYSKYNKLDIDEALLNKVAQHLQTMDELNLGSYNFDHYIGNEQND